jgi:hypothetical protein
VKQGLPSNTESERSRYKVGWPVLHISLFWFSVGFVRGNSTKDFPGLCEHQELVREFKRTFRRPRRRCEDNIKMDLKKIWWESTDWIHLAQGRERWWAVELQEIKFYET